MVVPKSILLEGWEHFFQVNSCYLPDEKLKYNLLLDWTQMTDSPLGEEQKAAWAVYRQALRDMTDTQLVNTVEEIVWPTRP